MKTLLLCILASTLSIFAQQSAEQDNEWFYANYLEIMDPIRHENLEASSQIDILVGLWQRYQSDELIGPQYVAFLVEAFLHHPTATMQAFAKQDEQLFNTFCTTLAQLAKQDDCDNHEVLIEFKDQVTTEDISGLTDDAEQSTFLAKLKSVVEDFPEL
ncbi:MAG: hypothetical protein ACRBF0_23790 [Calditrichia bacterium]